MDSMQARELRAERLHKKYAFEDALSGLAAFLAADTLRREENKEKLARGMGKEALLPSWAWVCRELVLLLQQYPGEGYYGGRNKRPVLLHAKRSACRVDPARMQVLNQCSLCD